MNMFLLIFVLFGLLLNLPDVVLGEIIIDHEVTGVLGEEVQLNCLYSGKHNIINSFWKRIDSGTKAKVMAGYRDGNLFSKNNFSIPTSKTNLTVNVGINSLDVEGKYTCGFISDDDEEIMASLFLTVIARPQLNTYAKEAITNGTYYQIIFCSASYAKPSVSLNWEIHGAPPSKDIFSIQNITSIYLNGTVSIVSMLRFPIDLNNENSVACVIQHPALTVPSRSIINLQTFVSPNITMEVNLIEKDGRDFFEVLCRANGGRPFPSSTWIKPESANTTCSLYFMQSELVSNRSYLPLDVCEGENIICNFGYPHHSVIERSVTLPTYYLTSLRLTNSSIKVNTSDLLILEEENSDIRIGMEVLGNVPKYTINCTKDGKALSEDVYVVVSDLILKGPVGANHVGQYQCQASYFRHTAFLQFKIEVNHEEEVQVRAPIHVTLFSNTSWENGIEYTEVNCMAANVPPDANITWDTENCKNGIHTSGPVNVSRYQQDHVVVWNTARLPVNSYAGCTIICVVHHHRLEEPVRKSIYFPLKGPPRGYVTVSLQKDSTHWTAVCEYKNDGTKPNISWVLSDTNTTASNMTTNTRCEGSNMTVTCIYKFKLCQHEGKFLTCVIQNEYREVERRTIQVPNFFISSVVVLNKTVPLHGSHGQHTGLHRVALKEHVSNQRIIFKVNGNASVCNIKCFRSNGHSAHTVGMALVFAQQVSQSDAGLYTCSVPRYHHNANITVLVDVTSKEIHIMMVILICFSSATAISLILMVTACIFCKRNEEAHSSAHDWKKHESLAALMQDPRSPELKKASEQGQEYAKLVHYSIVIDVKSTV